MDKLKNQAVVLATRIGNFTENTQKTGKDKRNESYLKARLNLLEKYWSQYLQIHDEIIELIAPEKSETDKYLSDGAFSKTERAYMESLSWIQDDLSELHPRDETFLNSTSKPSTSVQALKLPKINLPNFTGSYTDWSSFHDIYVSLIHENTSLPDIQKFHYLKSSLTGEAAKLLKHLSVTNANYNTAWDILINRYDNTRILVNAQLASLVNLRGMTSETSMELRRVLDSFIQTVRALENMKRPVKEWDDWLVYFISSKIDSSTRKDWETSLKSSTEVPTFESVRKFLEGRVHMLDAIGNNPERKPTTAYKPFKAFSHSHFASSGNRCISCNTKHPLLFCPEFRSKSIEDRMKFLSDKRICHNCLKSGHTALNCLSSNRCKNCNQKHHTMVHKVDSTGNQLTSSSPSTSRSPSSDVPIASTRAHVSGTQYARSSLLLATAIVFIRSADNGILRVRALLDQGSESNFISSSLAKLLNLPKKSVHVSVSGVGSCDAGVAKNCVTHEIISSMNKSVKYTIQSLVLPSLTHLIPSKQIFRKEWPHVSGLKLADPEFDKPTQVDLILGVETYAKVLRDEVRRGPRGTPIAQLTSLGWVLSGAIDISPCTAMTTQSFHTTTNTSTSDSDTLLKRFWEIEELPTASSMTADEEDCEKFFVDSHYRTVEGRYVIRLPFKSNPSSLGQSKGASLAALYRMERRFLKDQSLFKQYEVFMSEYLTLNHMEKVPKSEELAENAYYLPHHAVLKSSSTTTKLRVVFNASQKTTSGTSLNDILQIGPKLQNDVFVVLLKWRLFPFVLAADAEKMYRQILVDRQDTDFQRVLWRSSTSEPVSIYRLLTVTYGTASAPYLACRVLRQLADDHELQFPMAAKILREHFYVDDALFGAFDKDTCILLRNELRQLLQHGGFNLRKWLSNAPELLVDLPDTDIEKNTTTKIVNDIQIKALGIGWCPEYDTFSSTIDLPKIEKHTKRSVLADVSRIYDPLGWLSPTTISSKIFLQKLWLAKLEWDEELPDELRNIWLSYRDDIESLKAIQLARWLGTTDSHIGLELHGFCDASLSAYSATVYLRIIHNFDIIQTSLVAAKTRVSPLKTISLPRLELCGATLVAELLQSIQGILPYANIPVHVWIDSTIVLSWLHEHPSKWKVFIANRTSLIHERLPQATWHHVPTSENPADCATRGISTHQLQESTLWWSGPSWLQKRSSEWPRNPACSHSSSIEEELRPAAVLICRKEEFNNELLARFSDLTKLLHVTAYCVRFVQNLKGSQCHHKTVRLTVDEINNALERWIKIVQQGFFANDIHCISTKRSLSSNSKLLKLNPFLDDHGVLRLSGRLRQSFLSFEEKYPVILPKECHLTQLIIAQAHKATLHGGAQATLHRIRTKYWVLSGRSKVRRYINGCVTCHRYRASTNKQLMGELPSSRVRPSKPFLNSGVDYAGPLYIRPIKGRGYKTMKVYVAVFICLSTRACHLELVTDLTADAFIAAYRRFISRRGRCANLYSDNATNFVAADKILSTHFNQLITNSSVAELLLQDSTTWHFIPPSAPHFGGLWEAGVKAFKHHLRRVVGDHHLTMEEMGTLLTQIEACLNSRPLYALSDDPEDLSALTPAHFLVGENLFTAPAPSFKDIPINRLDRWQLVQQMYEHIWQRWYKEYVHSLQLRHKWFRQEIPVKVNDLVLIKDERLPPSKWLLGRVLETYPGPDGNVRVVKLRHKDGCFTRPITKLCVLPLTENN